jgi:hypothetical protein
MFRRILISLLGSALLGLAPVRVDAVVHAGDVAPDFHKLDLNGVSQTLFQYRGKVVVMFLEGYN